MSARSTRPRSEAEEEDAMNYRERAEKLVFDLNPFDSPLDRMDRIERALREAAAEALERGHARWGGDAGAWLKAEAQRIRDGGGE